MSNQVAVIMRIEHQQGDEPLTGHGDGQGVHAATVAGCQGRTRPPGARACVTLAGEFVGACEPLHTLAGGGAVSCVHAGYRLCHCRLCGALCAGAVSPAQRYPETVRTDACRADPVTPGWLAVTRDPSAGNVPSRRARCPRSCAKPGDRNGRSSAAPRARDLGCACSPAHRPAFQCRIAGRRA
jgi:hypothetical protein